MRSLVGQLLPESSDYDPNTVSFRASWLDHCRPCIFPGFPASPQGADTSSVFGWKQSRRKRLDRLFFASSDRTPTWLTAHFAR